MRGVRPVVVDCSRWVRVLGRRMVSVVVHDQTRHWRTSRSGRLVLVRTIVVVVPGRQRVLEQVVVGHEATIAVVVVHVAATHIPHVVVVLLLGPVVVLDVAPQWRWRGKLGVTVVVVHGLQVSQRGRW